MSDTQNLPADELAALKARVSEIEAELRNVKMVMQGLGFAGVNSGFKLVRDDVKEATAS